MISLRRLTHADVPRLREHWRKHWGGEEIVTRGNVYRPEQLDGFVVEDGDGWIGLLTFLVKGGECEVTSLDSVREGQGTRNKVDEGGCGGSAGAKLHTRLSHHHE
jgi:hypothetical protein